MELTHTTRTPAPIEVIDFTKLLEAFKTYLDVKPETVRSYTKAINIFFKYLQDRNVTAPDREDIIAFREHLTAKGNKPTTVQNYLVGVKQFFKFLEGNGLYQNVARDVKPPKISRTFKKDYLTVTQVADVLANISRATETGRRNYAITLLMVTAGLRTIEVSRANVDDIQLNGGQSVLYVQGKGQDDKAEYVKLAQEVEQAIRLYLAHRETESTALFTSTSNNSKSNRLSTRSISGIIKSALREAGLDSERLTAHSLRHTTATLNMLNGGTLEETQQALRHKNITSTMIYNQSLTRAKNDSEQRIANAIFK